MLNKIRNLKVSLCSDLHTKQENLKTDLGLWTSTLKRGSERWLRAADEEE